MSTLPPPPFGPDSTGQGGGGQAGGFQPPSFNPPGQPQQPQYQQPYQPEYQQPQFQPAGQPPSGSGGKKKGAIIAGLVVVAALAGGGIYIATKGDDDSSTASTDETFDTEPDITIPDITAPDITVPDVTFPDVTLPDSIPEITFPDITLPDISVPTSETPDTVAIPDGALDLTHGVYVPLPDGWSQSSAEGEVLTIAGGTSSIALQVLERVAGEDPVTAMQEYIDTFDTDYPAVSYSPVNLIDTLQGSRPVKLYRVYYRTFDPDDESGTGITGGVYLYMRSDGLTMVYDVYGSEDDVPGLEGSDLTTLETSFAAAPAIGDSVDLVDHEPFQVTTVTPYVEVEGFVGFYAAPGFTVANSGGGNGIATTAAMTVQVLKLASQPDVDTAVASAQTHLSNFYSNLSFGTPSVYDPDKYGVIHRGVGWDATSTADGRQTAGAFDLFFDPATGSAYMVSRGWFVDPNDPGTEPNETEADFMYSSFIESFTNIP